VGGEAVLPKRKDGEGGDGSTGVTSAQAKRGRGWARKKKCRGREIQPRWEGLTKKERWEGRV